MADLLMPWFTTCQCQYKERYETGPCWFNEIGTILCQFVKKNFEISTLAFQYLKIIRHALCSFVLFFIYVNVGS